MAKFVNRDNPKEKVEAMLFTGPAIDDVEGMVVFDDWLVKQARKLGCAGRYIGHKLRLNYLGGTIFAEPNRYIVFGKDSVSVTDPKLFASRFKPAPPEKPRPLPSDRET